MTDLRAQEAEFRARARGNGRADVERMLPPPSEPMRVARALAREWYTTHADPPPTLRHWRGGWWEWRTSLLDVTSRTVHEHTPRFFNSSSPGSWARRSP